MSFLLVIQPTSLNMEGMEYTKSFYIHKSTHCPKNLSLFDKDHTLGVRKMPVYVTQNKIYLTLIKHKPSVNLHTIWANYISYLKVGIKSILLTMENITFVCVDVEWSLCQFRFKCFNEICIVVSLVIANFSLTDLRVPSKLVLVLLFVENDKND